MVMLRPYPEKYTQGRYNHFKIASYIYVAGTGGDNHEGTPEFI